MLPEKKALSAELIDAQAALELPARELPALVNIILTDVLSGNQVAVAVPIGIAANVCGIQANVLAQGGVQEPVDCTSSTTQDVPQRFLR